MGWPSRKTFQFKRGGRLTLEIDVDLFELSIEDRELVFTFIDAMCGATGVETTAPDEGSAAGEAEAHLAVSEAPGPPSPVAVDIDPEREQLEDRRAPSAQDGGAGSIPASRSNTTCKRCGHGYWKKAHKEACGGKPVDRSKSPSNLICKDCGNHVSSKAHGAACLGWTSAEVVEALEARARKVHQAASLATPRAEVEISPSPSDNGDIPDTLSPSTPPVLELGKPCTKCGGRVIKDADGDLACMTCGRRQVAGASYEEQLAAIAERNGNGRKREPSYMGMKL